MPPGFQYLRLAGKLLAAAAFFGGCRVGLYNTGDLVDTRCNLRNRFRLMVCASEMRSTDSTTSCTIVNSSGQGLAVRSAIFVPSSTALTVPSINSVVFWRLPHSCRPGCVLHPQQPRSLYRPRPRGRFHRAFSARNMVWNAMSSMVLMIFAISPDLLLILLLHASFIHLAVLFQSPHRPCWFPLWRDLQTPLFSESAQKFR